jgi:3'(2'), 5'-bisphosphate nucleotidase
LHIASSTQKTFFTQQDHAAGSLIVREAGGVVSDVNGSPLDFSRGRTLSGNAGVIASNAHIHPAVLEAVKKTLEKSSL